MTNKNSRIFIMLFLIVGIVFTIIGATFAFFAAVVNADGNNVAGQSYTFDVDLDVTPINRGNLIPTADNLISQTLASNHVCEDVRGYNLCELYRIRLTNHGTEQIMGMTLSTINSTYTANHLKYQLYSLNNSTYTALSDAGVINHTTNAVNDFRINNSDVSVSVANGMSSATTTDVYLVMWISDIGANQLEDQNKIYSGILNFISLSGDTVTASFTNDSQSGISVTFDANGGTTPIATKTVTAGERYGALPTPNKSGSTFKGWNGKNKFDESKFNVLADYTINSSSYKCKTVDLLPSTDYKVSIIRYNNFPGTDGYLLIATSPPSTNYSSISNPNYPNQLYHSGSYTTDQDGHLYLCALNMNQTKFDTLWENTDVQMELGTTATAYEPYYVTSSTTVVQTSNHTLTAIWE